MTDHYARFITEIQNNPVDTPHPLMGGGSTGRKGLVSELAARYLDYVQTCGIHETHYCHCRILLGDFLLPYYGDLPADDFSPKCLKFVRNRMIESQRLCRKVINDYVRRIIAMFSYGIEEELCSHQTIAVLREVRTLKEGAAGTFDHPEREHLPEDVIRRTLPFLTPTLRTMVEFQWLTGLRPSEVCKLRAGQIDRHSDPDLWVYDLSAHKTRGRVGKRKIYLSLSAQKLIEPYMDDKKPNDPLFTVKDSVDELKAARRAARKSKITPSQIARDEYRAANPGVTFSETYDQDSYRRAIQRTIRRANKTLPPDEQIEIWFPYQIRHSTATFIEETQGLDESQAVLGHTTANMTKRYDKGQQAIQKRVALKQENPFAE